MTAWKRLLGAGWTWPVEADGVDGVGVDGPGRWSLLVVPRWDRVTVMNSWVTEAISVLRGPQTSILLPRCCG